VLECVRTLDLRLDQKSPALDFGCGVGRLTRAMAAYFPECCGVDISPTMVRLAQEFNQDVPQCRFMVNEKDQLEEFRDGYFGFIYTSIVLQHIAASIPGDTLPIWSGSCVLAACLFFRCRTDFAADALMRLRLKLPCVPECSG